MPGPGPLVPSIAPDVSRAVRIGLVQAEPVEIAPAAPALELEMEEHARALAARHAGKSPAAIPGLEAARELYHSFGIDPTRTRPSSEALLRRVLQGKSLPRILNAVDVCNLCSLRFLLPIGLYDLGKIRGQVTLARGGSGQSYAGIRKDEVHLEGRLVLSDEEGPFGNPTSDSLRTSVTGTTRALWMVIFAPSSFDAATLKQNVEHAKEAMARHLAPAGETVRTAGALAP